MKRHHEFYFDKKKTRQAFIFKALGLLFFIACFVFLIYQDKKNIGLFVINIIGILVWSYFTLRTWKEYSLEEPALIVNEKSLIFKEIDNFLKVTETEVIIDEIKTIGTDKKMKDGNVQYKQLNLKLLNSKELKFDIDVFGLTHDDLYKLILELKPEAKLLNIGEFEYD